MTASGSIACISYAFDENGVALQRISPHRLNDSEIVPDAHRAKAHIEIGEADPEQTHPCPEHVAAVETADAAIGLVAGRRP